MSQLDLLAHPPVAAVEKPTRTRRPRELLAPCPSCGLAIVVDEHGVPATKHLGSALCQSVAKDGAE